jgi:transposase
VIFNHRGIRVFVYGEPVDLRSGFDRLSYFVREHLGSDLLAGHVYLFLGRNRRRAKALVFDGTGLVLIHKRLEAGRFMAAEECGACGEITASELGLILDGAHVRLPMAPSSYVQQCSVGKK